MSNHISIQYFWVSSTTTIWFKAKAANWMLIVDFFNWATEIFWSTASLVNFINRWTMFGAELNKFLAKSCNKKIRNQNFLQKLQLLSHPYTVDGLYCFDFSMGEYSYIPSFHMEHEDDEHQVHWMSVKIIKRIRVNPFGINFPWDCSLCVCGRYR